MKLKIFLLFAVLMVNILFGGCKKSEALGKPEEVFVFAASSMTESLTELGNNYEKNQNGKVKVVFNFAGSQALKTSIENGSKADIFISASENYVEELKAKGFVQQYSTLLKNRLVIIRNVGSKFKIEDLKDLSADAIKIAVGDKTVPVGMYWNKALDKAFDSKTIDSRTKNRIEANIKTRELNVKDVLSKVVLNEVDAGVVYKTDVTGPNAQKLEMVEIPLFKDLDAVYPVSVIKASEDRKAVQDFYKYLFSDEAKELFRRYKFLVD